MTHEIVDAVKALEQEKGIDSETLMSALEDALLSAYKKTPGAANGTITFQKAWKAVAPSICAACSSSRGISRKNADSV